METVIIELTNQKAYKILKDLEELNIIKVIKEPSTLSSLRKKIQTKMSNEDINKQLHNLRDEWQRPI
jgi:DNA-binding PadR family transcriptional regulator